MGTLGSIRSRSRVKKNFVRQGDEEKGRKISPGWECPTARLLHCAQRTVRTYVPMALDLLSEILLDVGVLERTFPIRENSCQGGKTGEARSCRDLDGAASNRALSKRFVRSVLVRNSLNCRIHRGLLFTAFFADFFALPA
jgi:hypothetical protein